MQSTGVEQLNSSPSSFSLLIESTGFSAKTAEPFDPSPQDDSEEEGEEVEASRGRQPTGFFWKEFRVASLFR